MTEKNEHAVMVIPGLGDGVQRMNTLTAGWADLGLERVICPMEWDDGRRYAAKEKLLVEKVMELKDRYSKISVVGVSAGGSAAFNLMAILPDKIYKAVNNCGRLRQGDERGWRSFDSRTKSSHKFAESVITFQKRQPELTADQLNKMMTIRPTLGDELVPGKTCVLEGAENRKIFMAEHGLTIAYAMMSGVITRFLLK